MEISINYYPPTRRLILFGNLARLIMESAIKKDMEIFIKWYPRRHGKIILWSLSDPLEVKKVYGK